MDRRGPVSDVSGVHGTARLETSVASLDWTRDLLSDLAGKRLQYHLNPKPPLPQVWDAFFEETPGTDIQSEIEQDVRRAVIRV